ncbi:MAG: helix-turn-helix domain-containing protein [Acidobacteriota bacterium]|nr:helix-turn-helix domain-containing protein [Acidobacteriota bacterium]
MSSSTIDGEQPAYREYRPSARLAEFVECFWTHETVGKTAHRVLPDGCADLLFTQTAGGTNELIVVGTMTRARSFDLPQAKFIGVRFRPGMSFLFVPVPGTELVDQTIPLREIWGPKATQLQEQLGSGSVLQSIAQIESHLIEQLYAQPKGQPLLNSTQRVLSWAEQQHGYVRIDDLADLAGLSARQFRRVCVELTGLTPKQLCRALRFREAVAQLVNNGRPGSATLALDLGYYDQAHFINEFRAFSGLTPHEYCTDPAQV